VSRISHVAATVRSSPRRLFIVAFALFFGAGVVWAITTPPFGAGDEPAHVVRAIAIVEHGDLHGEKHGNSPHSFERIVQVPAIYRDSGFQASCYAFLPNVTPACAPFAGSSKEVATPTYAVRHPPTYYAVVAALTAWADPLLGLDLMRAITAAICAALLASATVSLFEPLDSELAGAGMLLALTPMALYLSGVVNPNGPEIAAGIAVWVSGVRLATEGGPISGRLVTRLAIAASVFTLSRETSPFWLLLVALTLFALTTKPRLREIVRERSVRLWAGVVFGLTLLQTAWDVAVSPFGLADRRFAIAASTSEIIRGAIGQVVPNYRESIGTFGWFADPVPMPVILLWTAGLGALIMAVFAFARRRDVLVVGVFAAIAIVGPTIADAVVARDAGFGWQGRYVLPFAAGIPIVAAYALRRSSRFDRTAARRLAITFGVVFAIGQIIAYAQQLRRYTVGRDGSLLFFARWDWSPPLPPWLLLGGYLVCIVGLAVLLTVPGGARDDDTEVVPAAEPTVT
jgi:hypothetical protein